MNCFFSNFKSEMFLNKLKKKGNKTARRQLIEIIFHLEKTNIIIIFM
jgi:hypothetical protein